MKRVARLDRWAVDALCADATAYGVITRVRLPQTMLEHQLRCSVAIRQMQGVRL